MACATRSTRRIVNPVTSTVLELRDLNVAFTTNDGLVRAVQDINLTVAEGETLAIVGESGSGKSQTFLATMGLLARNGRAQGAAVFGGRNLLEMNRAELDDVRGSDIAFIFQDPMTALNPSLTLARQLTEVLEAHRKLDTKRARQVAIDMLTTVGIPDAEQRIDAYPHQLSGGMRQRAMIAMALLCAPKVLIADEPTTALDVTLQAQILHLFGELKRDSGASIVLITHDLGVVAALAERVAVMYAGRIVETGAVFDIFERPRHPYTRALLDSTPRPDIGGDLLTPIAGSPPNLQRLPRGCAFQPRCPAAVDLCTRERPTFEALDSAAGSACFLDGHAARAALAEPAS